MWESASDITESLSIEVERGDYCAHLMCLARRSAHHVVAAPVFGSCHHPDFLRQRYEIKPAAFHVLDGLCHSVAPTIPDVVCPNGDPGWALVLVAS